MRFVITAYRPNGHDSCKGCTMGTSDSDFAQSVVSDTDGTYKTFLTVIAQEEVKHHNDWAYDLYELSIHPLLDLEDPIVYYDRAGPYLDRMNDDYRIIKTRLLEEKRQAEDAKALQAITRKAEQQRLNELATLAELKEKYENA